MSDDAHGSGGPDDATGPVAGVRDGRWACPGPAEIEVTIGGGRVEIDLTGPAGSGPTGPGATGPGAAGPGAAGSGAAGSGAAGSDEGSAAGPAGSGPASPGSAGAGAAGAGAAGAGAADPPGEVRVQVRAEPGGGPWSGGLGGLLDWIGSVSGAGVPHGAGGSGRGFDPIVGAPWEQTGDPSAEAVGATTVSWSDTARRLVVRGPDTPGPGSVPLVVTVSAPPGSRLAVRTGAADVRVRGRARWAAVRTGSGAAHLDEIDGDADVTTGSGGIELGAVTGRARLRAGGGAVEVAALGGPSHVRTGAGDVHVGEVAADLELRTGSGDVVLADAVAGALQVTSGSGGIRVGVHAGVAAELDLSTGSGRATSDLDVGAVAPEGPAALRVSGRTGSGDVLVTRAIPVPA